MVGPEVGEAFVKRILAIRCSFDSCRRLTCIDAAQLCLDLFLTTLKVLPSRGLVVLSRLLESLALLEKFLQLNQGRR